ncbi:hypothetical protein GGX14DRAFT_558784 [Mycena pura]|uniref:Uncharacterized protein n=1 Tax=Mycena pura TaxID=153505 RepID=A0AAD6VT76_9AGAR|nr:hypothetical protein GGX14DRAFT_558784 [Mycena pura]
MSSCAHVLNSDISGIGVRISYYLQTFFLGCLSVRSGNVNEIIGALYTLMATNIAMAATGLILGFKPQPEISFQDAVVIIYLLSMGWITAMVSLASCKRLSDDTGIPALVPVIHAYTMLSFAFAVLATATTFGQHPECNNEAVAVIFHPFSALGHGRIAGWCIVGFAFFSYTETLVRRTRDQPPVVCMSEPDPGPYPTSTWTLKRQATDYGDPRAFIDYPLLVELVVIFLIWVFFMVNTELVIHRYQPTQEVSVPNWQFGQILPMFLTILPITNMVSAFITFGMKPTKQVYKTVKVFVIHDAEYDPASSHVRRAALASLSGLGAQVEFQQEIWPAIPMVVELLKDSNPDVRRAALDSLSGLGAQAEFQLEIQPAIPMGCTCIPLVLEHKQEIWPAIPMVVELLKDSYSTVRQAALESLSGLGARVEFQQEIRPAIPIVVELLKDSQSSVCRAALQYLSGLQVGAQDIEIVFITILDWGTLEGAKATAS